MDYEKAYKEVLSRAKTKYDSMMEQGVVGMAENIAKCSQCPFYHEDKNNVSNSYCRYGGGWGWGLKPDGDCYFGKTVSVLEILYKFNPY